MKWGQYGRGDFNLTSITNVNRNLYNDYCSKYGAIDESTWETYRVSFYEFSVHSLGNLVSDFTLTLNTLRLKPEI